MRLTTEEGWHDIAMNEACTWYFDSWSSFNFPGKSVLRSTDGKQERTISTAADPLEGYASVEMEFGTVKSADGLYDNYYRLYKPLGFDPSKKFCGGWLFSGVNDDSHCSAATLPLLSGVLLFLLRCNKVTQRHKKALFVFVKVLS